MKKSLLKGLTWRSISCFGRNNQQDLFNVLGSMFTAVIFFGINNCSTVIPLVATERTVLCRERFAGMYSSWAYSLAQVQSSCESWFNIIPVKFIKTLNMVMKSSREINLRTTGSFSRSIFFCCLVAMKLTFCSLWAIDATASSQGIKQVLVATTTTF